MWTGSGYLQNDATLESFTDTSSRTFHFNATDYAFFIKNIGELATAPVAADAFKKSRLLLFWELSFLLIWDL